MIDVTAIPEATVGDEAVILGQQGSSEITPQELAEKMGIGIVEMIPRLLRSLPHVHMSRKTPTTHGCVVGPVR